MYRAGLGIDLDLADGAAVREHRIVHLVVRHHADALRDVRREIVGQILSRGLLRQLEEIEAAVGLARESGRR